jgi:hypothetical protein
MENKIDLVCPYFLVKVENGVVQFANRANMICVKWTSKDCRMCATDEKQESEILTEETRQ